MEHIHYSEFEAAARAAGFDEVLERHRAPLTVLGTHEHPFAVQARVVAGEMWLTPGESTRHLRSGDRFTLQRDKPHAELYGEVGATFWVARRN